MSWVVSNLADTKGSLRRCTDENLIVRGSRNKEAVLGKKWVGYDKVTFLQDGSGLSGRVAS